MALIKVSSMTSPGWSINGARAPRPSGARASREHRPWMAEPPFLLQDAILPRFPAPSRKCNSSAPLARERPASTGHGWPNLFSFCRMQYCPGFLFPPKKKTDARHPSTTHSPPPQYRPYLSQSANSPLSDHPRSGYRHCLPHWPNTVEQVPCCCLFIFQHPVQGKWIAWEGCQIAGQECLQR